MHGAPVAGGVGVFACEEEGVVGGDGHFGAGVDGSGGDVAVGSEGERVALPVVGDAADELVAEEGWVQREDGCEFGAGGFAELFGGEVGEGLGAWAANPAGEGVAGGGMGGPPDGRHGAEGEEEDGLFGVG